MKRSVVMVTAMAMAMAIFLTLITGSIGQAEPIKYISQRTVDAVVKGIDDEYIRAFNARDAKAFAALFTEEATFYSEGSVIEKRLGIKCITSNTWSCVPMGTRVEMTPITSIQVASDVIVTHGLYYETLPDCPVEIYAYTRVLVKLENDWQIAANQITRLNKKGTKQNDN